jgi:hypothetical protein
MFLSHVTITHHMFGLCSCFLSLFHAQSVMVNILELSIMKAIPPFEICISGGGAALAALNWCNVNKVLA